MAKHAPYLHDGSLATLRDVVEFYNRGGMHHPFQTRRLLFPLALTSEDVEAVVGFLESLSGEGHQDQPPKYFPR